MSSIGRDSSRKQLNSRRNPIREERIVSLLRLKERSKKEADYITLARTKCRRRSDALTELEEIYSSLQLNDEELLDRAERRDLPSRFQLMKYENERNEMIPSAFSSSSDFDETDEGSSSSVYSQYLEGRQISSVESRFISETHLPYLRTPSLRRSAIPDLVHDDYAVRKLNKCSSRNNFEQMRHLSKSTSYLLLSSAYTPSIKQPFECKSLQNFYITNQDPNIEKDDLYYRRLTQSDAANVLPRPPPFGIPLPENSHVDTGSQSYLHLNPPTKEEKNKLKLRFSPNVIRDDLAFRSYRKDCNNNIETAGNKEDTVPETFPVTLYHTYNNITRLSTLL